MQLAGSVVVVTGAASGLGLATATGLAAAGAQVVLADLPAAGAAGARVASDVGGTFVATDVTDEDSVRALVEAAAEVGPLRVVVSCAGIATPGRVLGRSGPLDLAAFRRVVEVNLVGTFNVLRLGAEVIARTEPVAGERGVVINTASIAAFEGQVGQAAYAASKGGVVGMTLPIARDLAGRLIRVVTIAPGLFDTPLLQGLPEPAREALGATVPMPARLGRPAEYAALVRHVVENPMLNGEVIRLDGALRMAPR